MRYTPRKEPHIYGPPPYQPAPPRRGVPGGAVAIIAIGCLMFGMLAGCVTGFAMGESQPKTGAAAPKAVASSSSARPKRKASPPASASASAVASVKPKPVPVTISDGTWRVPQEVKPGTYRMSGSTDGLPCYWARLRNLTGELGGIIANGNPEGPTTITIRSSDKGFTTRGCDEWKRI